MMMMEEEERARIENRRRGNAYRVTQPVVQSTVYSNGRGGNETILSTYPIQNRSDPQAHDAGSLIM